MATELPASMGIKKSSWLTLAMYVCMYVCMYGIQDCQDLVKDSKWVLFPSTMAEQPIQQIICMYVYMLPMCGIHHA